MLCPGAVKTDIGRNSIENRRARHGRTSARSPEGDKLGDKMAQALAGGMEPDDVGHLVLDAILHDHFWIFTEPRLLRHLQQQVDVMVNERALSRLRLV